MYNIQNGTQNKINVDRGYFLLFRRIIYNTAIHFRYSVLYDSIRSNIYCNLLQSHLSVTRFFLQAIYGIKNC